MGRGRSGVTIVSRTSPWGVRAQGVTHLSQPLNAFGIAPGREGAGPCDDYVTPAGRVGPAV
eukprot:9100613-Pyramimonas_sp.AAC.1